MFHLCGKKNYAFFFFLIEKKKKRRPQIIGKINFLKTLSVVRKYYQNF